MFLITCINYFINIMMFLILASALMSWFVRDPYNPIYRLLNQLTEPIVAPCRKLLSRFGGNYGLDFSPMLAMILLIVIRRILFWIVVTFVY